jgi:hypothetical protein
MKHLIYTTANRKIWKIFFCLMVSVTILFMACKKGDTPPSSNNDASKYSSDVIDKWISMQIRLMRDATKIPNVLFSRYYAYTGVAAFEALSPGSRFSEVTNGKWNGLTGLPHPDSFKKYYWPASVNASLASINRNIFVNASTEDKAAIDSLENALHTFYLSTESSEDISRSVAFGQAVASAVFNWSETDGIKTFSNPYTPPAGLGLWVPTPPAMAAASTPYFGNLRPIIKGSIDNTQPGPPIAYSEDPKSPFFQMVLQVYNAHQNITPDQTAWALFWRDIPGVTTGGHWESILQQVLKQTNSRLDKAAYAYAVTGVCNNDPCISCWKTKYFYNLVRPIIYIRDVMKVTTWNSTLTTPAHPEYSSAHAVLSTATAEAMTQLFGNIGSFTDHTYDYLGFMPRTFSSFRAIGEDAANSRLYAGIHYQPSIDTGIIQGRKVAENILAAIGVNH